MISTCLSLLLAGLQVSGPSKPELLPEVPPGWRFERIDFPLAFAPDLTYPGFEELEFAPGMFQPKSETYFTYVFAMKLEVTDVIDAAFLDSLLERYYRGLCDSASRDRNHTLDPKKIQAEGKEDHYEAPKSRHFHAKLQTYDPFVTNLPLTLNLEILVIDAGEKDKRLMAAVSPKPTNDPLWNKLRALKQRFYMDNK